jgi:transcriptional regulator with XRE-family HTH domain
MMLLYFNSTLVRETRKRISIKQADFAKLLDVSEAYLSMLEKGQREPSLAVIRKLVGVTEVPVEKWLSMNPRPESEEISWGPKNNPRVFADMKNRLHREHRDRLRSEERNWGLEQSNEHLMAENILRGRFEDIVCDESLSREEKQKRLERLARWTMEEGVLTFEEIRTILRMGRSTLRNCLDVEKQPYECVFTDGGRIMASSPGEAALCLRCFDCASCDSGKCVGYGDEKHPENIIVLLKRLKVNGVYDGTEQARIIETYYDVPMSARDLADIRYRYKKGLSIPDEVFYLDMRKKS